MPYTVAQVVKFGLMKLRVIDPLEPVPAELMQDSIAALNAMVTRWEATGIALGWSNVSAPTDTLPAPDEAFEAIGYNLAVRRRADFGVTLDQDVLGLAKNGMDSLRTDVAATDASRLDYDLPAAETAHVGDFYSGGY